MVVEKKKKKTINFTHLQLEYRFLLFHQDLHQQLCNSETEKMKNRAKQLILVHLLIWVQHIGFILIQHMSRSVTK